MEINFPNKIILVTGATRGIGRQISQDLESLGAKLILTGTKQTQIDALRNLQKNKKNDYYCVDFTDEESTSDFITRLSEYDRIDVCINNAGINRINFIYDSLSVDWDDVIRVNLRAPFMITREVSRIMKRNGYGRIVNISSIFGAISRAKRSIYSTTKSGLIGFTRAVAIDLAPYNILVNCVAPGFVLTELTKNILKDDEIEVLKSQIPIKRLATADEISKAVLFLASDLNTYITGQNLIVDGGYVIV